MNERNDKRLEQKCHNYLCRTDYKAGGDFDASGCCRRRLLQGGLGDKGLHSYGSHFNYKERYPSKIAKFKPDNVIDASPSYRTELINAYDNTIVYTDYFLSEVINHLNNVSDADVAMIYISDHGEDIFDDSRNRFLHASPIPTYYQLHVPMVLWMSKNYRNSYPELWNIATINKTKAISSSKSTFHTILQIAGIETQYYNPTMSLTDSAYIAPKRVYLSDRNEELQMNDAGMNFRDYNLLKDKHLFHQEHPAP